MLFPHKQMPKLNGVEWIIDGYIGAQPRPIVISPAKAIAEPGIGINNITIPATIITIPSLIIFLSPNLSAINPHRKRPNVIPM